MTTQVQANDKELISYSFPFLFLGLFLLVLVQAWFIFTLPTVVNHSLQSPSILAGVHLFLLGFAVTVAMGAMIQLVPVALQTTLFKRKMVLVHFCFYIVGVCGMVWSFVHFQLSWLLISSTLTLIGVILFEVNLLPGMIRSAPSSIKEAILSALIYLFLTFLIGITMVVDFLHPFLGDFHDRLFAIHVTFGVLGWFTLLIMGFSFKLVPMFSLSHNYESKWASRSIGLLNFGLVCLTFGFLFAIPLIKVIGCVLTALSLLSYAKQMQLILKNRLRKRLDIGVKTALSAGPFTFIVLILAVICALLCHQPFPLSALMYTTITGWIGLFILGFLFKIVPFLWWTFKYSSQIGHTSVPSLKNLTNEKRGKIWFVSFYILIFLNAMCLTFHFRTGIQWVQAFIFLNTLLYAMDLVKVITFKPDQPAFTKNE